MKKITFEDLYLLKNTIPNYRYFIVTGVCEPVVTYIRYFLERYLDQQGAKKAVGVDRELYLSLGYDEEAIAEYEESLISSSAAFERVDLAGMYTLNVVGVPRLCEMDLAALDAEKRAELWDHIKSTPLDDSLLEKAPRGAYCISYFDSVSDYEDEEKKKAWQAKRMILRELDDLERSLNISDMQNRGRSSRLLWIDASVWYGTHRAMYNWALDILSDKATNEYLWECIGACGELSMLRKFYANCSTLADTYGKLGAGQTKKDIRKSEFYESLLFIDGRAFGWDVLRYFAEKSYKGRTLRTEVMRSIKIEHSGIQSNTYRSALKKCLAYLGSGQRYIKRLFHIRCLLECGSLSLGLGDASLRSKECRELCKKYGLSTIRRQDLERAAQFDLLTFRDILRLLSKEYSLGRQAYDANSLMAEIEEGVAMPVFPMLKVFLALEEHRKLVEVCT